MWNLLVILVVIKLYARIDVFKHKFSSLSDITLENLKFRPIFDLTETFKGAFKGALSYLRQFLATEIPFKTMKTAFYFTLKAFFVIKIFKFLSWLTGHVEKWLG